MSYVHVPLVTNRQIRTALRLLYPEVPAWAREWLIVAPNKTLPTPPGTPEGARTKTATLLAELEDTCAAINATNPTKPWSLQQLHHVAWIGPANSQPTHRARHAKAVGRIINIKTFHHDGPKPVDGLGSDTFEVTLCDKHGRLVTRPPATEALHWRIHYGKLIMNGHVDRNGLEAERILHPDAEADDILDHPSGAARADGTASTLTLSKGKPTPEQRVWAGGGPEVHNDTARELLRRWHALPSRNDKAIVTEFWLGHPHPALAAAGLAITTMSPMLLSTAIEQPHG
jgi:hypothetical protein